tara:strand:- start:248 stop:409 length:162 start_codon:yes stop_codon:yes gene_type:complete
MNITREQLNELTKLMEDSVQYYCMNNVFSGETCWKIIECLAVAKQEEFRSVDI